MYKTGKEINFDKFIWVRIEENDFSKVLQCKTEENKFAHEQNGICEILESFSSFCIRERVVIKF